jgi:dTMP kinase
MDKKVPFVAFEGIDKCGKGTQSLRVAEFLADIYGSVFHFHEPNYEASMVGKHIQRILQRELPAPDLEAFQRLYVINRAEDTVCGVLPALEAGTPVVADRFVLSTVAYGSLTQDAETYVNMHREVLGPWLTWPDLTIIIDISAKEAMRRLELEGGKPELFERADKLSRIRTAYLSLEAPMRMHAPQMKIAIISGEQSESSVFNDVRKEIELLWD